jgi:hypothetical protein
VSLHLVETNKEGLQLFLEEAWIKMISDKVSGRILEKYGQSMEDGVTPLVKKSVVKKGVRKGTDGIGIIDVATTRAILEKLDAKDSGAMQACITGALAAGDERVAICRSENNRKGGGKSEQEILDLGKCACGFLDEALEHRWIDCPLFNGQRTPHSDALRKLRRLPLALKGFGIAALRQQECTMKEKLWRIPWPQSPDVLQPGKVEIFTDGSADPASEPGLRLAAYALVNGGHSHRASEGWSAARTSADHQQGWSVRCLGRLDNCGGGSAEK